MSEHAGLAPPEDRPETPFSSTAAAARKRRRDEDREHKRELKRLGLSRSRRADAQLWLLAVLLVGTAAAGAVGAATHKLTGQSAVALAAVGISVAGLLVGLLQWRNGLAEKAFDALYQRIAMANQMRLDAFGVLTDEEQVSRDREHPYRFFVYSEIDSLEYAARRYRFGLGLSAHIFYRAVTHFRTRCRSDTFRRVAESCAADGGYFRDTKTLVTQLLQTDVPELPKGRVRRFADWLRGRVGASGSTAHT
jgi:hypothetical protein